MSVVEKYLFLESSAEGFFTPYSELSRSSPRLRSSIDDVNQTFDILYPIIVMVSCGYNVVAYVAHYSFESPVIRFLVTTTLSFVNVSFMVIF